MFFLFLFFYTTTLHFSECTPCAAGLYSSIAVSGQTSSLIACNEACSPGKYSPELGLTSDGQCKGRCSAGKFSVESGLTSDDECQGRCSVGKFSAETGLSSDG